eukprot:2715252-Pyramimonas_sp.AAC.1
MVRHVGRSIALAALLACVCVNARPSGDEITELAGWNGPLPSRMYAGYVSMGTSSEAGIDRDIFGHYFFVESENDPENDPLLVWSNGGPGASSFFGLFVEFGPFLLSGSSQRSKSYNETGVPELYYNPYTWSKTAVNQVANILIINAPAPVGYSYCMPEGPAGDGYSCGKEFVSPVLALDP